VGVARISYLVKNKGVSSLFFYDVKKIRGKKKKQYKVNKSGKNGRMVIAPIWKVGSL
jgi:hypothetical protein